MWVKITIPLPVRQEQVSESLTIDVPDVMDALITGFDLFCFLRLLEGDIQPIAYSTRIEDGNICFNVRFSREYDKKEVLATYQEMFRRKGITISEAEYA